MGAFGTQRGQIFNYLKTIKTTEITISQKTPFFKITKK